MRHFFRVSGFTLVEVLVALVVTGLLVAILMSSLYHVFRVQDRLHVEVVEREAALRARAWFTEAIEACLPVERRSTAAFSGTPQELHCETLAALEPRSVPVPLRVRFALRREEGRTQMTYSEQGQDEAKARVIAEWPGTDIRFAFVDAGGVRRERWPPDTPGTTQEELLPALVRLEFGQEHTQSQPDVSAADLWLVALRADSWIPPPPSNPFGLKPP